MSVSIPPTHRPWDNFYTLFLMSFAPTIIFDCISLYPRSIVPSALLSVHEWYKVFFNDQLVITQPTWFRAFTLIEGIYEFPLALWGIWALKSQSPEVPARLLIWALVCFSTTFTCLLAIYYDNVMSDSEKWTVIAMYGLYAVIFGIIGLDMYCRIQKILVAATKVVEHDKTR
ncbi:hypothetical protein Hypma_005981 [Hypsizygus marmoreus]|uniref:Efficient mitochondria targeting-associated protein 19 n=1 Tax=Hypsizygus marmoreus TaxID=39966 RepID=A0A369KIB3_HYPMA|nr:hypothetical protein Hypma_005981 [Hypsizygus marmoreus]